MRIHSFSAIVLSVWACSACSDKHPGTAGGQSGSEGSPETCGAVVVELDEATPAGTARALFDSFSSPKVASLRWYAPDGGPSHSDTALTLSLSGTPGTARYYAQGDLCAPFGTPPDHEPLLVLEIQGSMHFETADGAFNEAIPGAVRSTLQGNKIGFSGGLAMSQFAGTYDIATAAAPYPDAMLFLDTNQPSALLPLNNRGQLTVAQPPGESTQATIIADWTITAEGGSGGDLESGGSGGESGESNEAAGSVSAGAGGS